MPAKKTSLWVVAIVVVLSLIAGAVWFYTAQDGDMTSSDEATYHEVSADLHTAITGDDVGAGVAKAYGIPRWMTPRSPATLVRAVAVSSDIPEDPNSSYSGPYAPPAVTPHMELGYLMEARSSLDRELEEIKKAGWKLKDSNRDASDPDHSGMKGPSYSFERGAESLQIHDLRPADYPGLRNLRFDWVRSEKKHHFNGSESKWTETIDMPGDTKIIWSSTGYVFEWDRVEDEPHTVLRRTARIGFNKDSELQEFRKLVEAGDPLVDGDWTFDLKRKTQRIGIDEDVRLGTDDNADCNGEVDFGEMSGGVDIEISCYADDLGTGTEMDGLQLTWNYVKGLRDHS